MWARGKLEVSINSIKMISHEASVWQLVGLAQNLRHYQCRTIKRSGCHAQQTKIVENAGWKWSVATGVTSLPVQD